MAVRPGIQIHADPGDFSIHDLDVPGVGVVPVLNIGDDVDLFLDEGVREDLLRTLLADDQDRSLAAAGGGSPVVPGSGAGPASRPEALPLDDPHQEAVPAFSLRTGDLVGWSSTEPGVVDAFEAVDASKDVEVTDWLPVLHMISVAGTFVDVTVDHDGIAHDTSRIRRSQPVLVRRAPSEPAPGSDEWLGDERFGADVQAVPNEAA